MTIQLIDIVILNDKNNDELKIENENLELIGLVCFHICYKFLFPHLMISRTKHLPRLGLG